MQCPRCKTELPGPEPSTESRPRPGKVVGPRPTEAGAETPEEALRADTPPAPCPQCGWSTMWNE